jgi:methionine synthase I (cobalamin-dependent)
LFQPAHRIVGSLLSAADTFTFGIETLEIVVLVASSTSTSPGFNCCYGAKFMAPLIQRINAGFHSGDRAGTAC